MAIKIGGTTIVTDDKQIQNVGFATITNAYVGVLTVTSLNVLQTVSFLEPTVVTYSPGIGSTGISPTTSIFLTFSENVSKGTGNITITEGSSGGVTRSTIGIGSTRVVISAGKAVQITPQFPLIGTTFSGQTFFVNIPAGGFIGSASSNPNSAITNYSFTTRTPTDQEFIRGGPVGASFTGGSIVCKSGGIAWIIAPSSTEVTRCGALRFDSVCTAESTTGILGQWFLPSITQACNPGYTCLTYWDSATTSRCYWSCTDSFFYHQPFAQVRQYRVFQNMLTGACGAICVNDNTTTIRSRAFRCVTY